MPVHVEGDVSHPRSVQQPVQLDAIANLQLPKPGDPGGRRRAVLVIPNATLLIPDATLHRHSLPLRPATYTVPVTVATRPAGGSLLARRKERTRRELAEAATRLFLERGYDGTTVEEIASAVDISPRTFFRYFPTKGDIVVALSRTTFEELARALWERPACEPPAEALAAAVEAVLTGDPAEVRAFERLLADNPGLRAAWLQASHNDRELLTTVLAERFGLDPAGLEARVVASAITSAVDAALEVWGAAEDDGTMPMAAVKEAIALLTRPLLSSSPVDPAHRR